MPPMEKKPLITAVNNQRPYRLLAQTKPPFGARQAEIHLQQLLNNFSDGFFTVDRNWIICFATESFAQLVGLHTEALIGRNLWEAFPGSRQRRFHSEYVGAFLNQQLVSFEEYDSRLHAWFEINAYPSQDFLSVYVRDITQRKLQEQRTAFVAKATSEVIWERDINGEEVAISGERMEELFGYRIENDRIHRSFWLEKIHPDDVDALHTRRVDALKKGLDCYVNEYRFRKLDGSWAYVKDRTYVVKDADNRPARLIGAMKDVTQKMRVAKALRESERKYKQLFNNNPLCKLVFDLETLQVLEVNDTAVECFGYTRQEAMQMTVLDFKHPSNHSRTLEIVGQFAAQNRKNVGVFPYVKKDGTTIFCSVSVTRLAYKGRQAVLASLMDVTENVRLQQQLQKEKQQQHQAIIKATIEGQEKERNAIGRELHDNVNQVISSAKLYIENIRHAPEQTAFLVKKGTELLQHAIEEIRRLSHKLATPSLNNFGLAESICEMVQSFRDVNRFHIEHDLCLQEEKLSHEQKITVFRIFQELLNNTVKYAGAANVRISVSDTGHGVHCTYEDDGIGFDATSVKKGLGLHNVQNRVEAYNGSLTVVSAPGRGFRSTFTVPYGEAEGSEQRMELP